MKKNEHQPEAIAYGMFFTKNIDRLEACAALGMPLGELGAAILGRPDRLAELIKADPTHFAGEAGSTALYLAAGFDHIDCVKLLLDAKTDPNARMPSWDTPDIGPRPLEGAAEMGNLAIVKLLLERGADPSLITFDEDDWAGISPEIRALMPTAKHS
jgi:ankyrin repeat protein